jgi:hypothetical protein
MADGCAARARSPSAKAFTTGVDSGIAPRALASAISEASDPQQDARILHVRSPSFV